MRVIKLLTVFAALTAVAAGVAQADLASPPWGPATPNFNLEAILAPVAGGPVNGFGLVKFRQPKDADRIVNLDVWVRDLAPNHSYSLQRATDANVNDDCAGANWAMPTLGQVATDETGTGRADLFRNLAAIPLGTQLDIHFRVIDAVTSAVVLESACYQFTVSQ
jgi:hypothetical protein